MKTQSFTYGLLLPLFIFILSACSNTKHLPANDALYLGATVKVKGEGLSKKKKSDYHRTKYPHQAPAQPQVPGHAYQIMDLQPGRQSQKETSFRGKMKNKTGEPPVLLSDVNLARNTAILQNYLENRGFFRPRPPATPPLKIKGHCHLYCYNRQTVYHRYCSV
ncbi:hypothetical protein [Paraflavitalea speifideaquila]|uniref:hypothetical protein n=1 Tax=Paraflavitalea speifideaquila TaxID=3076558 RepID=UPI0028E54357|nr:hypothetical protein [Paraflavitalea speifideiaquila]